MAKYATVDDYMASLPPDRRAVMEQLRRTMAEKAPEAREVIAYNMPAARLGDRFLVSYEAYKNHYSIFPWTERMREDLGDAVEPYIHGKGTLRFPANEAIPIDLVRRIIEIRLGEVSERGEPGPRPDPTGQVETDAAAATTDAVYDREGQERIRLSTPERGGARFG